MTDMSNREPTNSELLAAVQAAFDNGIAVLRADIAALRGDMNIRFAAVNADLAQLQASLDAHINDPRAHGKS